MRKKIFISYSLIVLFIFVNIIPVNAYTVDKVDNMKMLSANFTYVDNDSKIVNSSILINSKQDFYSSIDSAVKTSNDSNAKFTINQLSKNEVSNFKKQFKNATNTPTELITITYTNEETNRAERQNVYVNYSQVEKPNNRVKRMIPVDTVFDIGAFTMSLAEFNADRSFWNGFWVVADAVSVALPYVPSVSGVKRMIKASDVLKASLEKGVQSYSKLQRLSEPARITGEAWERHHIFEKRFVSKFSGASESNMLSIFLPYSYHTQITTKMKKAIPWYSAPLKSADEIIDTHIRIYEELWAENDWDEVFEFLKEFAKERQTH